MADGLGYVLAFFLCLYVAVGSVGFLVETVKWIGRPFKKGGDSCSDGS